MNICLHLDLDMCRTIAPIGSIRNSSKDLMSTFQDMVYLVSPAVTLRTFSVGSLLLNSHAFNGRLQTQHYSPPPHYLSHSLDRVASRLQHPLNITFLCECIFRFTLSFLILTESQLFDHLNEMRALPNCASPGYILSAAKQGAALALNQWTLNSAEVLQNIQSVLTFITSLIVTCFTKPFFALCTTNVAAIDTLTVRTLLCVVLLKSGGICYKIQSF